MQRTFRIVHIDVMDTELGHESKSFNPEDREDLRKMVRYIAEKLSDKTKTFALYGALRGQELKKLLDPKALEKCDVYQIEDKLMENDSFILREHPKMMVAAVPHRG